MTTNCYVAQIYTLQNELPCFSAEHQNDLFCRFFFFFFFYVTVQSVAAQLQAGQWHTDSYFLMISPHRLHV